MDSEYDVQFLIIGAGPAGLQLGYGLEKLGASYKILEASEGAGSFFRKMPRFRQLISFNKRCSIYDDPEIALRWDWNSLLCDGQLQFPDYSTDLYPSADDMVRYLEDFAERFVHNIEYNTRVTKIRRREDGVGFEVERADGQTTRARALIVATGFCRPFVPEIPGIELVTENYSNVAEDPRDYEGQRVLIIGKGNSAFEIADHLLATSAIVHLASPKPVRFAWQTRHAGDLRANYTQLLDTYQLKLLNSVLDCHIHRVWKQGEAFGVELAYTHAQGEVDRLEYDRIILCTGFRWGGEIFDESCRPNVVLEGRFPEITPGWEVAGQPDLYIAGTLMQSRDFRRAASAFIDGFRYNVRTLTKLLAERYLETPYPSQTIPATTKSMIDEVLPWVCRTSSLWTQFGYLSDVVVVKESRSGRPLSAEHYRDLPVDYVRERFADEAHIYQITFEWGDWDGDIFAIERRPQHSQAHRSAFLHPVIRRISHGEVLDTHHMLEDLFGMWRPQTAPRALITHDGRSSKLYHELEHIAPLKAFFAKYLEPHRRRRKAQVVAEERTISI